MGGPLHGEVVEHVGPQMDEYDFRVIDITTDFSTSRVRVYVAEGLENWMDYTLALFSMRLES